MMMYGRRLQHGGRRKLTTILLGAYHKVAGDDHPWAQLRGGAVNLIP
jgi:hypothetical protein